MYAEVIVDIAHESVARVFTYWVPKEMPIYRGSRVRVPFGPRKIEGIVLALRDQSAVEPEKIKPIEKALEDYPAVPEDLIQLAQDMAQDAHCPLAQTLRLMLPAAMRGGRVKVKTEKMARLTVPYEDLPQIKRSPKQQTLLTLLKDGNPQALAALKQWVNAPNDALKKLSEAGLVTLYEEERLRAPYEGSVEKAPEPVLTAQQREVLLELMPDLEKGRGRCLLYGVTGSGKTEVYLSLVRQTLKMGKSAIILVPEIALTPQMVLWFRRRFNDQAAVMHSRLSDGERYDEWRRVLLGQARVVIGARSAIFAPVQNLGLIVIDEEHEQSYRSDHHPRYDARDVAVMRADREKAMVLLSSATPSILSFARARRGDYTLLEMDRRVLDRPLPSVQIVDMRRELENGNRSIFSDLLKARMDACLKSGQQAILFLNRRGYSSFVSCRKCGHVMKCRQCDIAMTLHKDAQDGQMHCHYCGSAESPPKVCPECGSPYIRFFGLGTQRVEEEVQKLWPDIKTLRMDLDTTGGKDAHHTLLSRFANHEAQVLIGTQMIAKGLDFPAVTLVGVVAADTTLNLPDYRARERTFQLLTQVAGRAGRGEVPGEVVIQTYKPEDEVVLQAARQDYTAFFETEFLRRRTGLYPPFTLMARILVQSRDELAARAAAKAMYEKCGQVLKEDESLQKRVLFIRWDDAPVKFIKGRARCHVLMKLFDRPETQEVIRRFTDIAREGAENCEAVFELNPASMM